MHFNFIISRIYAYFGIYYISSKSGPTPPLGIFCFECKYCEKRGFFKFEFAPFAKLGKHQLYNILPGEVYMYYLRTTFYLLRQMRMLHDEDQEVRVEFLFL